MMGKIDSKMRRGQQRMKRLDSINSTDMSSSKFLEMVRERGAWCATVKGSQSQTWLSNWATTTIMIIVIYFRAKDWRKKRRDLLTIKFSKSLSENTYIPGYLESFKLTTNWTTLISLYCMGRSVELLKIKTKRKNLNASVILNPGCI